MSDFIGYLFELILMARWPRRILLGGLLAIVVVMGGLTSQKGWISIGVIGGLLLFLEILDVVAARSRASRKR
ncbi:MAG: hypothetical protein O9333_06375 [Beijerinckiaceae bacterium]|jgi:hypothetical protein|nr:hypothetical protein [Beijerinckiaceae bacterium]